MELLRIRFGLLRVPSGFRPDCLAILLSNRIFSGFPLAPIGQDSIRITLRFLQDSFAISLTNILSLLWISLGFPEGYLRTSFCFGFHEGSLSIFSDSFRISLGSVKDSRGLHKGLPRRPYIRSSFVSNSCRIALCMTQGLPKNILSRFFEFL